MMKNFGLTMIFFSLFLTSSYGGAQWENPPVPVLKERARAYLLKRKKGFDEYLQKKAEADKKRLADAYKMKAIRKEYAEKQEKLRKSFVRTQEPFPKEAYQAFLRKREQRRKELENTRVDYVEVQDELEKIYENEKYKIDGNKEFDL